MAPQKVKKKKGGAKGATAPKKSAAVREEEEENVPAEDDDDEGDDDAVAAAEKRDIEAMVIRQNKKKKKSGGFQSMGLSQEVFRAVIKKGYRVPTPIQRKTIPLIMEGRDVVAMARTGSGKTACFLIPLFHKLKARSAKSGARALILSPTKELALQTRKFTNDLGRFTGLKSACVLGGESMEKQFALIHENPDIIIATPGRFVHVCVEMGLKLSSIEYVVFDEADRLFEMGFGEQLREILSRLPDARQMVLFSATLPKLLVEFARAGLSDPSLIRLDVDTKIPDTLKMAFFHCRAEGKTATLLHLLKNVISEQEQTVVFCETRHHVEYLHLLLDMAGVVNTYIYSHLDSSARKINAAKFHMKKARVLIVTDLAARGIDIPLLDNVINYNFPSQSKLFVHRVGRVARAGRTGTSFSLIAGDEMAYFMDLQLFLGNSLSFISPQQSQSGEPSQGDGGVEEWHNKVGEVPQKVYDDFCDQVTGFLEMSLELHSLKEVADRGYLKYLKSRPSASHESVRRVKALKSSPIGIHPLLVVAGDNSSTDDLKRANFLEEMKNFRPPATIFEIGNTANCSKVKSVMFRKRKMHENAIEKYRLKTAVAGRGGEGDEPRDANSVVKLEESSQEDIQLAFGTIFNPKPTIGAKVFRKKARRPVQRDEANYIGYKAKDHHTEAGYALMNNFDAQASGAVLDLTGDDETAQRARKNMMRWDAKKKKYVRGDANDKKKIKTESGVWIPATYKSDRYNRWKEKSKMAHVQQDSDDEGRDRSDRKRSYQGLPANHPAMKKAKNAMPQHKKGPKIELKTPEQVLKQRKLDEKKRQKNMRKGRRKKR